MKKFLLLILVAIFNFSLYMDIFAFEEVGISDYWYEIVDNLDENSYGGIYVGDDGFLHIKPIEGYDVVSLIKDMCKVSEIDDIGVVFDEIAEYSYSQLREAQDKVFSKHDVLEINSVETRNKYNSILVGAAEWDDNKKERVKEVAGIENIIFEVISDKNDIDNSYAKDYFFRLNDKEITSITDAKIYQVKYSCYDKDGVFMIPLNTLFSVAEQKTELDYENGKFRIFLDNYILEIDRDEKKMKIDNFEKKLLISPIFLNDECYIAFNDVIEFIEYDYVNQIFSIHIGDNFSDKLKNYVQSESGRHIYTAYLGTNKFLKDNISLELDTDIYNKEEYLMFPVRALFTAIDSNAEVKWDNDKKVGEVITDKNKIEFLANENKVLINSNEINISGSLDIKDNRLFIPLRTIKIIYNLSDDDIYWDDFNKIAYLRI